MHPLFDQMLSPIPPEPINLDKATVARPPIKKFAAKTRKKPKWKLKFHHQALPPEYLDHYEASLQASSSKMGKSASPSSWSSCSSPSTPAPSPLTKPPFVSPPTISTLQPRISPQPLLSPQKNSIAAKTPLDNTKFNFPQISRERPEPAKSFQSTVRFTDLPYMGEMTLDNARPRRGRKPKKADICHLIYKNYGTTVLDEPLNLCVRDKSAVRSPRASSTFCAPPTIVENGPGGAGDEMSMCKFKFTAGALPKLQEKKRLSLDSAGTFRYSQTAVDQKRLKKSPATENLEKTFKENGFLIQTQQFESAQGATYCKFRQLRKFTRYLFRSWKSHLPTEIVSANNQDRSRDPV